MSVVRINAITVPPEHAEQLVARFAARAGEVAKLPGFEAFELLRPTDGKDVFLVYTRWESQEAFDSWLASPAFQHGHARSGGGAPGAAAAHGAHGAEGAHGAHGGGHPGPVSTNAELWSFDVVQHEEAARP